MLCPFLKQTRTFVYFMTPKGVSISMPLLVMKPRGRVGEIKNREKHKGSFKTIHVQVVLGMSLLPASVMSSLSEKDPSHGFHFLSAHKHLYMYIVVSPPASTNLAAVWNNIYGFDMSCIKKQAIRYRFMLRGCNILHLQAGLAISVQEIYEEIQCGMVGIIVPIKLHCLGCYGIRKRAGAEDRGRKGALAPPTLG